MKKTLLLLLFFYGLNVSSGRLFLGAEALAMNPLNTSNIPMGGSSGSTYEAINNVFNTIGNGISSFFEGVGNFFSGSGGSSGEGFGWEDDMMMQGMEFTNPWPDASGYNDWGMSSQDMDYLIQDVYNNYSDYGLTSDQVGATPPSGGDNPSPKPKGDPCSKESKDAGTAATSLANTTDFAGKMSTLKSNMTNHVTNNEQGFYIGSNGSGFNVGDIQTGPSASGIRIQFPTNSGFDYFADVHTHPETNNAQSPGDLYEMGTIKPNNSSFTGTYVVTNNGSEYYVWISDATKLASFTAGKDSNYDSNTGGFKEGTDVRDEFDEAFSSYLAVLSEQNARAAAMAYIMEKYDTGLVLYKKDSEGTFKPIKSQLAPPDPFNPQASKVYQTGGC